MLYNVFLVMLVSGALLFIVSIIFMFIFHIPEIIDELSGRKAKRQIKRLKKLNAGTGALDGVPTNDVYQAMSSGSELVETISQGREVITGSLHRDIDVESSGKLKELSEEVRQYSSGEDLDEIPTGYTNANEVEQETGVMETGEVSTNYMEEDEFSTSFFEDEEQATGILSEINEFISSKRCVIILEEQTSVSFS